MSRYIHERPDWPRFRWDQKLLAVPLAAVRHRQGCLIGRMEALGLSFRKEAVLQTLTLDVLKSSEIEGEMLKPEQVRSSLARRLGMDIAGLVSADRNVEGVVEMMLDATQNFDEPLTVDRLFDWHAALFPTGRSGLCIKSGLAHGATVQKAQCRLFPARQAASSCIMKLRRLIASIPK